MPNEYQPMDELLKNPDWKAVEGVVQEQIASLLDLREVDMNLSPDELKIELRARDLAAEKLIAFYEKYKFSTVSKEANQAPFR